MVTIMVPLNQTASFTFLDIFMIIAKILSPSTIVCYDHLHPGRVE